jgi:hypothetical protein
MTSAGVATSSRADQGLPEKIQNEAVLDAAAALLADLLVVGEEGGADAPT